MRSGRGVAILLTVGLIGAALLVGARAMWPPRIHNELAELAAAVGPTLPFDARLTGGFLPPQAEAFRRSGSSAPPLSPDARIAIAQLEKRAVAEPAPQTLAALGVGYLVQGEVDRAISTLEDAASMGKVAAPWSDLSAAYLVKAQRQPTRHVEYLSRALEASAKSLRLTPTNEARFNRALAIDGLTRFVGETEPWIEYFTDEEDPRWLEIAKRHAAEKPRTLDAMARWDARQRELRLRLAKKDQAFVDETAKLFPEATTEFFGQLLKTWADAQVAGDSGTARSTIDESRLVADAIQSATSDRLPNDEIGAMRSGGILLAQAHLAYREGVRQYNANDYQKARDSLVQARAGFSRVGSPYRFLTDRMLATILFQQRDLGAADRELAKIEASARAHRYKTLLGRVLWVKALVYQKDWRLTEAFAALQAAAASYEESGQFEFVVSIHSLLADTLRTLGEQHASWQSIGKTLEGLERIRVPLNRYLVLYNASLFASRQDLFEAALLFQNATVREATKSGAGPLAEALTQRAIIHLRRGDRSAASEDLRDAMKRLDELPEGPIKEARRTEISVLTAELGQDQLKSGMEALQGAIAFFDRVEPARIPALYLRLGRMHSAERPSAAENALAAGIARLEKQQVDLGDEALRISYFDESWDLFQEMIALQLRAQDHARVFEYAERARARSLLASTQSEHGRLLGLEEIERVLPTSVILVYYVTLSDRVLIWSVSQAGSKLVQSAVQKDDLRRLIAQHRSAIIEGRDSRSSNDRLHDILIRPVANAVSKSPTIVFVPDGGLQQLPFAAFRTPGTERYLVEDHAVVMSPSASFYAAGLSRLRRLGTGRLESALLIGNPATAAPRLTGAEAEVIAVAKLYSKPSVVTGQAATKDHFLKNAPRYDVVHFGGHAYANAEYPLLSRLSFSADANAEQALFAHEISGMRFDRTKLVMLAACSTADGAVSRGEGVVSVARPFLGAGVPVVVASQWDVGDRATEQLSFAFHRALSETQDPIQALRTAQVSLIRSQDSLLASPASWGAFVALGTTAR